MLVAPAPFFRVHLGYAPGGGKTTRLLADARALTAEGLDVVIAWADDRGRADVRALTRDLEHVPPRRVEFHGCQAEEMDLDAVLARRPALAVVDDLAHANAPGARHGRRHADVAALLDAGIGVLSALDVSHLERLKDVVERVAGFEERLRVPDLLLDRAHEVLALDLPVPLALARAALAPGAHAGQRRAEALASLRELMLREAAARARPRPSAGAPPATGRALPGRVMVALSSLSPRAGTLLRHGSRFAGRLDTSWFVVYVETPAEAPERIDAAAERALLANVELARALGAEVVRLKARDPLAALLDFGRSHGVRHIVLGRSRRRAWRELLRRAPGEPLGAALRAPFHERLLRQARDFDVYVVAQEEDA